MRFLIFFLFWGLVSLYWDKFDKAKVPGVLTKENDLFQLSKVCFNCFISVAFNWGSIFLELFTFFKNGFEVFYSIFQSFMQFSSVLVIGYCIVLWVLSIFLMFLTSFFEKLINWIFDKLTQMIQTRQVFGKWWKGKC